MSRLTPLKPIVVIRILKNLGFKPVRQKGSHIFFRHPDGRTTVVPFHKGEDISRGLIRKILQDIELSWQEFISAK
ncbi:MAG: type II toxin-antitoxin system HicA family toxin [Candidatus Omnitrophica bacterium]|nr:type II toxin-antitoxin system HicA family toxin [Candidatus Omnitrophota bacterium]